MLEAYGLYGVQLKSPWRLPYASPVRNPLGRIEFLQGSSALFSRIRKQAASASDAEVQTRWYRYRGLADGSEYVRWTGHFEFLVSPNGRRIVCRTLNGTARASFETYLLNQALSFALVKQGIEPLHATVVSVDGTAVGFLGGTGYGKSTLAAAFLRAGDRLLTDDALVLKKKGSGYLALPGPPRIKLYRGVARAFLGSKARGTQMNRGTAKLIVALNRRQRCMTPIPLRTLYAIVPSGSKSKRVTIRRLPPRQAFLKLLENTFNRTVVRPERLKRQFRLAAELARALPVRALSYPRTLAALPAVRDAILADLQS